MGRGEKGLPLTGQTDKKKQGSMSQRMRFDNLMSLYEGMKQSHVGLI